MVLVDLKRSKAELEEKSAEDAETSESESVADEEAERAENKAVGGKPKTLLTNAYRGRR